MVIISVIFLEKLKFASHTLNYRERHGPQLAPNLQEMGLKYMPRLRYLLC